MRTETVTVEYNVYKFNELSDDAKENVKEWYLKGHEPDFFTDDCKMDLYNLFGKNNLDVEYSLGCRQGDGFNIYGSIDAESIFSCLEKHNGDTRLEGFNNILTEKEKRTILHYAKEIGEDIKLPSQYRYTYCLAHTIDIADDWEYQLDYYYDYKNINVEVLRKFESWFRNFLKSFVTLMRNGVMNTSMKYQRKIWKNFVKLMNGSFLKMGQSFNK